MGKVAILLSDKRSGSTMVQSELCKHPKIQHVEYSPHTYFETHHWLKAAVMLGMPEQLFHGGRTYPGYGSRKNARAYLVDCVEKNVPGFQVPNDDRELVFAGWDALCEKYCQPVFFEKSPQYLAHWASLSLILEWIERTDHEVKVIGLIRNPMAVMHSAQELFHTDPESRQFGWLAVQRNMLTVSRLLPENSFMHLRYEDLIASPTQSFDQILNFVGLEGCSDVGSKAHPNSIEKWRADEGYDLLLAPEVRQMALHFGLDVPTP